MEIMAVQLNHTIVWVRDQESSANYVTEILGLPAPGHYGPFTVVQVSNEVSLDYRNADGGITPQHYAFLVTEPEFDEIFGRIKTRGQTYWAHPGHAGENEINTRDGGRGLYFDDPDGHALEILTRPYGSGES